LNARSVTPYSDPARNRALSVGGEHVRRGRVRSSTGSAREQTVSTDPQRIHLLPSVNIVQFSVMGPPLNPPFSSSTLGGVCCWRFAGPATPRLPGVRTVTERRHDRSTSRFTIWLFSPMQLSSFYPCCSLKGFAQR